MGRMGDMRREPTLLLPATAGRDEWLAARTGGIGGSDVGAIVGLNRYTSPTKLFYQKLGIIPGDEMNAAMEWGNRLETPVREKFADEHPELLVTAGPGLVCHPDRPWQMATVDGLIRDADGSGPARIFEAKTGDDTHDHEDQWGEPGTDQVPPTYLCQVTWYMDIYGAQPGDVAWLAVLLRGRDYREYRIPYDPAFARKLVAHADYFRRAHLIPQVPPPADAAESTTEALTAARPPVKAKSKGELPPEAVALARAYGSAHRTARIAETQKERYGNQLRALFLALGDKVPHYGYVGDQKIASWSVPAPPKQTFDEERFAADHPGLYQQYLTAKAPGQPRLTVAKEFTSD